MKSRTHHIVALVKKDLLLELRQQYSFYGVLLYVASTSFVIYLTMGQPDDAVWNALFWITQLFVCVNAVAKSFLQESKGKMLYYYNVSGAVDFMISKLIFNTMLMLTMSVLSMSLFVLLLGNPITYLFKFIGIACLGGISLGFVFTFLASIAAQAQQQAALMAIMGFPLIIPQLLLLMKIANTAFSSVIQSNLSNLVAILVGMDVLVIALAIILFPFLWKD